MIIPKFWGNARIQIQHDGRQFTIKKFGWSDESQTSADEHAQERAKETVKNIRSGEDFNKRDRKIAYNGEDGLPIREEIIESHDDFIITRNVYGALCLNTPDVLFADIDFHTHYGCSPYVIAYLIAIASFAMYNLSSIGYGLIISLFLTPIIGGILITAYEFLTGGKKKQAPLKIEKWVKENPEWHLRLYKTPNGYRVLALHDLFNPKDEGTINFMKSIYTDSLYTLLCKKQNCFRARVSPKPWRIGIDKRLSEAVWPVTGERLEKRRKWVYEYEASSRQYGSCKYIKSFGSSTTHPKARKVQEIHDRLCKANNTVEIA